MAKSSLYGGRIALAPGDFSANDPVDTLLGLTFANNALHYADQMGQVKVAWVARDFNHFLTTDGLVAADEGQWRPITTFGPFPLTIGADGRPYKVRTRLAARSTDVAVTITMRAVLSTYASSEGYANSGTTGENVLEVTTASTASSWLAPVGGSNVLALTTHQASEAQEFGHQSRNSSGDARPIDWVKCVLRLWAKTPTASRPAEAIGLYAAEFVGT